jgi:hypothetical protein
MQGQNFCIKNNTLIWDTLFIRSDYMSCRYPYNGSTGGCVLNFDGGSPGEVVRLAEPIVYMTSDLHYHCYWTDILIGGDSVVNVVGQVVVEVVGRVVVAVVALLVVALLVVG